MIATSKAFAASPESVQAKNSLIRPIVVFDGGNRTIQWIDPYGTVQVLPAFIKQIDPSWEEVEGSDRSLVIEHEGETFVIGHAAKDLNGTPVFQQNKTELAQKLVFAALEPNPGQPAVRIERMIIALPSSKSDDTAFLKAIEGTHEFTRNSQRVIAHVRKVEPIDETRAAYTYATQQGLFRSGKNPNGVLDLGGGTSIARLYSTDGTLIREADVILPGTYDLARRIAARITRDLPNSPDLSLIMDGIESGRYEIGTTGYCFQPAFDNARDAWLMEIRAAIKTRWAQWLSTLGEVLVIGGSAPLAMPLSEATGGRFKIASHPQTISIIGMLGA